MNKSSVFLIAKLVSSTQSTLIKYIQYPLCKNCLFFQNYGARCGKFGNVDLVTGEVRYDFAFRCRSDRKKCGVDGKYFVRT